MKHKNNQKVKISIIVICRNLLMLSLAQLLMLSCTSEAIKESNYLKYVNPLVGTAPSTTPAAIKHGHGTELLAQTFPAVGVPFGMTNWTPQTQASTEKCVSPYYYRDSTLNGFRASHWLSGSCTQDYGSVSLMPLENPDHFLPKERAEQLDHSREVATPAYYSLHLNKQDLQAEMTGLSHAAIFRFSPKQNDFTFLAIQPNVNEHHLGRVEYDDLNNEITGYAPAWRIYQGWGENAGFAGHFVVQFQEDVEFVGTWNQEKKSSNTNAAQDSISLGAIVKCFANQNKEILVKIGLSFTSVEHARKNLEQEIPAWDFDAVRSESEQHWEKELGKIEVEGNEEQKAIFYTALYHSMMAPREFSDVNGAYSGFAQDTQIHTAEGFKYYADFSFWDTYRALHPLHSIINRDRTLDMVKSIVAKAEQGTWLPIFPCWNNYTAAMIGDHATAFISDAHAKGIRDFDTEMAFKYMYQNATQSPESYADYKNGMGRRALASYLRYGYIPLEDPVQEAFHKKEQVSRTLEYAFDDFALANFAQSIGKQKEANELYQRAKNYTNVFDTSTGFMRGKHADGAWMENFDPFDKKERVYTEGSAWQYTWYVPHDVENLIDLIGGDQAFIAKLDSLFTLGEYWHGNEPSHQIPYLYNYAGAPQKTQERITEIIKSEYGPGVGGLSGNDDSGQMSAWLIFSSMGFYPVCPGKPEYALGIPSFDRVTIHLENGNTFKITKNQNPGGAAFYLNGQVLEQPFLQHEDILKGGVLNFSVD